MLIYDDMGKLVADVLLVSPRLPGKQ
jgi:hypothetical protein